MSLVEYRALSEISRDKTPLEIRLSFGGGHDNGNDDKPKTDEAYPERISKEVLFGTLVGLDVGVVTGVVAAVERNKTLAFNDAAKQANQTIPGKVVAIEPGINNRPANEMAELGAWLFGPVFVLGAVGAVIGKRLELHYKSREGRA